MEGGAHEAIGQFYRMSRTDATSRPTFAHLAPWTSGKHRLPPEKYLPCANLEATMSRLAVVTIVVERNRRSA